MVLIAGSYERFIWGFSLKTLNPNPSQNPSSESDEPPSSSLKLLFSFPSHTGPIKCAAISGPLAVSGGADDTAQLYDLRSASQVASLTDFSGGSISAAAFYTPSSLSYPRNLILGSDSGAIAIYDADLFAQLKIIPKVHKKGAGVADLAVHPSGRLALTVGRGDSSLAMVNLVRGRRSFVGKLEREAAAVRFNSGGDLFFMASGEKVSVHSAEDARELGGFVAERKIICISPTKNHLLISGGEERDIKAWDVASGKDAYVIKNAHSARVKGVSAMSSSVDGELVASAAADGVIRIWDARMVSSSMPTSPLAEVNTKSRLTCLAAS